MTLLDVTPWPPAEASADELLCAFDRMFAVRESLLATPAPDPGDVIELLARDRAWHAALASARDQIGASRIGAANARRYR